ncbi:MAG: YihY/virulence factor BrkB family protein [Calditrichaceae bacterium]|nr:YihY/virulence factor BrkB family protein [Calditrichaceae bacterium]
MKNLKFKIRRLYESVKYELETFNYDTIWEFIKYYAVGIYNRANDNHLFLFSAGLAFSLLICIMPFILLLISLLGNLLANESIRSQLASFFQTVIPYSSYADFVNNLVSDRIEEIKNYKNVAGYVGLVGLFFAASGFFSTLRTILNRSFQVIKNKNFLIGKLRDFGMILTLVFSFLVITLILPFWEALLDAIPKIAEIPFIDINLIKQTVSVFSSPVLLFVLFFIFYKLIPYERMSKKVVAVSALWASILWTLAEMLFGYFLVNFAAFNRIYGAYVFFIVVIFWIYYSAIVFILGAHIGQLYRERKERTQQHYVEKEVDDSF